MHTNAAIELAEVVRQAQREGAESLATIERVSARTRKRMPTATASCFRCRS